MKYEIMIKILFELLAKKTLPASYLSDKYGISVRTVYRYIECLELSGVPVYTKRGNGGGFSLIESYRINSSFLTKEEFDSVISSLSAINDGVQNSTLDNAILKLKATSKNSVYGFEVGSGELIIDGGPWGDALSYKEKTAALSGAITTKSVVKINYHDRNGKVTERLIEPHALIFKQGIWYVLAYCRLRKEFRFFKTGRIGDIEITKEVFTKREINKKDLEFTKWYLNSPAIDVTFEVNKSIRSDIEEWLGIENVNTDKSGRIFAKVKLPDENGLIPKILSYGSGLKIISPEVLKDKVLSAAKEIIKNY